MKMVPISFAGGETANVSIQFIRRCETLTMFEVLPSICDAMCTDIDPIPVPGLEFDRHADLLSVVSTLDAECDRDGADAVYDDRLDRLNIRDLFTILHIADYLQHARALGSCARVIAGRLRGKTRSEMLDVLGIEEPTFRQRSMDSAMSWILPESSIRPL